MSMHCRMLAVIFLTILLELFRTEMLTTTESPWWYSCRSRVASSSNSPATSRITLGKVQKEVFRVGLLEKEVASSAPVESIFSTEICLNQALFCAHHGHLLFSEMPVNGEFSLNFEFFPWVLSIFIEFRGEIFGIFEFLVYQHNIGKKWRIGWFSYLESLTLRLKVQIFKMYLLNFGKKMPENGDFCLSFELFPWVSGFLSFGVLEFFSGAHKKKPVKTLILANK